MTWSPALYGEDGGTAGAGHGSRRRFRVHVDGVPYIVEVEELVDPVPGQVDGAATRVGYEGGALPGSTPARPRPHPAEAGVAPPPLPSAGSRPAAPAGTSAGARVVKAPMPGLVLSVAVTPGQAVGKGDLLLVLSAMNLENEVRSPEAGVVSHVAVRVGQTVNTGESLVALRAPAGAS